MSDVALSIGLVIKESKTNSTVTDLEQDVTIGGECDVAYTGNLKNSRKHIK